MKRKISIFPLLLVSFIGALGFSIVLPSLVYLVKRFSGPSQTSGDFLFGALGATYSAFQLFGAPLLGKLSDTFGRKRILLLSEFGSVLAWICFVVALYLPITMLGGFSTSLTGAVAITLPMLALFFARAVEGITGGDVAVANAYLSDITDPGPQRKSDFGKMGVAGNLGFMAGPVIAGFLGETSFGLALPILVALGTSVLAFILTYILLPESKERRTAEQVALDKLTPRGSGKKISLSSAWSMPKIPLLLTIYFVFFVAFSLFTAAFPLFAVETLHWSIAQLGIFFTVLSVIIVVTEGPILSYLSKKFSAQSLTIWGTFIVVLSYLSLMIPQDLFAYLAAALYAIGNGLMWPSFLSLLSDAAGEEAQGYVQGIGSSAGSIGSIIGLLTGGALYSHLRGITFVIPALLVFVVFLMSFKLIDKQSPKP